MRKERYVLVLLLLLLAGYLLTGVTQVRQDERAVVRRFGRVVEKPGPGLHFGLPYGMDRVDRVRKDFVQSVPVGYVPEAEESDDITPPGQLLTGDHNLVNVSVVVDYTVNGDEIEDYVVQAERVDGVIARVAEAVLAEWVAQHSVDDVLLQGKAKLPGVLVRRTQKLIEPYRLGVVIQRASVAHLFPPSEVKFAFDEVTRAQTAILTAEHQAQREAGRQLREAQAEKNRIEQLTAAYVQEQLVAAKAEAAAFERRAEQYHRLRRDNPSFLAGLWWEEIGSLLGQMKEKGRIDLLDNHLGADGLDITVTPPLPRKSSR
jgi:membrane protease subunit HflK